MLINFFQIGSLPTDELFGNYDLRLVALSYMVALFASYIALDLTARLRDKNNTAISSLLWLLGGAIAMGAGIWSMHFIGMLSFSIPGLTLQYDVFWTALSLVVAILASGFALYLLKKSLINVVHLIAGAVILGLAIASMHYTGMAAMLISLNIKYIPTLFILSIFIALVASSAAIWLALRSNKVILKLRNRFKFGSAIIMGLAICGMHYTGMAASIFTPCATPVLSDPGSLNPTILSMAIAAVTFIILGIAFFASTYKEAINQQQFEQGRQLGMAEISANVLHNVGNVLNSINVSANTLSEKISSSKLSDLEKLCVLLNENKQNLSNFITQDPRGSKVLDFLNNLDKYRKEERRFLYDEIDRLLKNIVLIKDIISTQQNLSKTISNEDIISMSETLDEALLITGLNLKNKIIIKKRFEKLRPIISDKIKLLQIFSNIFHNAKDALIESTNKNKLLTIDLSLINNKIIIKISDNGVGIKRKNINKIFFYGFTTKPSGHGFGLHTTAISISELGGEIQVESEGYEKGTLVTLELPYKTP